MQIHAGFGFVFLNFIFNVRQVRLDANGNIILDESSLVVNAGEDSVAIGGSGSIARGKKAPKYKFKILTFFNIYSYTNIIFEVHHFRTYLLFCIFYLGRRQ